MIDKISAKKKKLHVIIYMYNWAIYLKKYIHVRIYIAKT